MHALYLIGLNISTLINLLLYHSSASSFIYQKDSDHSLPMLSRENSTYSTADAVKCVRFTRPYDHSSRPGRGHFSIIEASKDSLGATSKRRISSLKLGANMYVAIVSLNKSLMKPVATNNHVWPFQVFYSPGTRRMRFCPVTLRSTASVMTGLFE